MSQSPCFSVAPESRRCLVAIVHNGPVVYTETARSLMELGFGNRVAVAKETHGFEEIVFAWFTQFPRVDSMRDFALEQASRDGFSHVLFLDADMIWPSDVLVQMLRHHDKGIVGGLYVLKGPPYSPVALADIVETTEGVNRYAYQTDYGTELVDVNVLGMGCTLVPTAVTQLLGRRPWFHYENDQNGWPRVSEDVPFCRKAKAAGVPILFDPTVKCGHVATQVLDERYHWRYQQSIQAAAQQPIPIEAVEGAPV